MARESGWMKNCGVDEILIGCVRVRVWYGIGIGIIICE